MPVKFSSDEIMKIIENELIRLDTQPDAPRFSSVDFQLIIDGTLDTNGNTYLLLETSRVELKPRNITWGLG